MDLQNVVGTIIAVKQPLDVQAIAGLAETTLKEAEHLLTDLGCIISLESAHGRKVAHMAHPSCFEFLTDNTHHTNPIFFINTEQASLQLAFSCLTVMKTMLRFNICGLKTSHL
jgi:hypothetical protein